MGALLGFENCANLVGAEASAADGVECAGDAAHHFVEKSGAFGGKRELFAALDDCQRVHGFYGVRVVVLTVAGAVCGKVVRADQVLGGGIHGVEVQWNVTAGPDVAVVGRFGAAEGVAVFVALAGYGEAGVKVVADGLDRFDLNRRRQLRMQRTDQLLRWVLPIGIEVEALPVGMHAGIGASTALG